MRSSESEQITHRSQMVCAFSRPFRDQCLHCNLPCFGHAITRQTHDVRDQVGGSAVGSRARIPPGLRKANVHALARESSCPIWDQARFPDPASPRSPIVRIVPF